MNRDLEYREVDFDRELVKRFMELWERQLIRGKNVTWAFREDYFVNINNEGHMLLMAAFRGDEIISLHMVERYDDYLECHPPTYDKTKYNKRYLAKFMWFGLIKYAHEVGIRYVDFGGGGRGTWRDLIHTRKNHKNTFYKWGYVPQAVKENPDLEPHYVVINEYGIKRIVDKRRSILFPDKETPEEPQDS